MEPINYAAIVNPDGLVKDIQSGFNAGALLRAQDQAQQMQQQYLGDVQQYMKNPTAQGAAAIAMKYPSQAEQFRQSWNMIDKSQRDAEMKAALPIYSALSNDAPDVAQSLLEKRIQSLTNSGMNTDDEQRYLDMIKSGNASAVHGELGLLMAKTDPENFTRNFVAQAENKRKQDLFPSDRDKADADARKATFEAGNAPVVAAQLSKKTAEEIKNLEAKRQIDSLDIQIRQANSETERGKLQLERDKLTTELEKNKRTEQQSAQDQLDVVSQSLETVSNLLGHPGLAAGTGRGGNINAWFAGSDAADFRAMLNTVKSQQFLAGVSTMKGTGQLSDAEGARIEQAVASLDTKQSPAQMRGALGVIKATLERAQSKVIGSGRAPVAGGTFVMKHPVYGVIREGDVNRLMSRFPGATREQVLSYLRSMEGK